MADDDITLNPDTWPDAGEDWQLVAWYHQRTKHHFNAYARSPGELDWANQPAPFRTFRGAKTIPLPKPATDQTPPYEQLYKPGAVPAQPQHLNTVSQLFFYAFSVSAWKSFSGSTWALRCNPSSGNLHPTEAYIITDAMTGLNDQAGVYHYRADEHGLEQRTTFTQDIWTQLAPQTGPGFYIVLTSIHWREAWKYGERAYRYCQHDVGHAITALRFAAALLGWKVAVLTDASDTDLNRLVGVESQQAGQESGDLLLWVSVDGQTLDPALKHIHADAIGAIAQGIWTGQPNALSDQEIPWKAIDWVHQHCQYFGGDEWLPIAEQPSAATQIPKAYALQTLHPQAISAGQIIRQRRSAQTMDGQTSISQACFYAMLARTVPALTPVPWDCQTWPTWVHLAIFVHRVTGLEPGLYGLVRATEQQSAIQQAMNPSFLWQQPTDCPSALPLYLLQPGDARQLSAQLSCGQAIAADGAFSLGMFAHFLPVLKTYGAHCYRRLLWETGMLGQVLYLEAEAFSVRGTGIGCFFDDPVHQALGFKDMTWQSLYHFTVGGAIEDTRLQTIRTT